MGDFYRFSFPPPAAVVPTLAQVLAVGNATGGTDIVVDAGDVVDVAGQATIGASGPTLLIDNPTGQTVFRTPMTTAGAEVGIQVEDAAGSPRWRIVSFLGSDSVSAEWAIGAEPMGAFRVGPDPSVPDIYAGMYATEGDVTLNVDGGDPTVYVDFYAGDRVVFGDSTGQDQEIEVVTTVVQLFEATGLAREMRWTPPAVAGSPWVKTFGGGTNGEQHAKSWGWTSALSAVLAAAQNDYAPAGVNDNQQWRLTAAGGGSTITGIGGINRTGRVLTLHNISTVAADTITLTHQDVLSLAANRFALPGNAALVLLPNDSITLVYDATSLRWRVQR